MPTRFLGCCGPLQKLFYPTVYIGLVHFRTLIRKEIALCSESESSIDPLIELDIVIRGCAGLLIVHGKKVEVF